VVTEPNGLSNCLSASPSTEPSTEGSIHLAQPGLVWG